MIKTNQTKQLIKLDNEEVLLKNTVETPAVFTNNFRLIALTKSAFYIFESEHHLIEKSQPKRKFNLKDFEFGLKNNRIKIYTNLDKTPSVNNLTLDFNKSSQIDSTISSISIKDSNKNIKLSKDENEIFTTEVAKNKLRKEKKIIYNRNEIAESWFRMISRLKNNSNLPDFEPDQISVVNKVIIEKGVKEVKLESVASISDKTVFSDEDEKFDKPPSSTNKINILNENNAKIKKIQEYANQDISSININSSYNSNANFSKNNISQTMKLKTNELIKMNNIKDKDFDISNKIFLRQNESINIENHNIAALTSKNKKNFSLNFNEEIIPSQQVHTTKKAYKRSNISVNKVDTYLKQNNKIIYHSTNTKIMEKEEESILNSSKQTQNEFTRLTINNDGRIILNKDPSSLKTPKDLTENNSIIICNTCLGDGDCHHANKSKQSSKFYKISPNMSSNKTYEVDNYEDIKLEEYRRGSKKPVQSELVSAIKSKKEVKMDQEPSDFEDSNEFDNEEMKNINKINNIPTKINDSFLNTNDLNESNNFLKSIKSFESFDVKNSFKDLFINLKKAALKNYSVKELIQDCNKFENSFSKNNISWGDTLNISKLSDLNNNPEKKLRKVNNIKNCKFHSKAAKEIYKSLTQEESISLASKNKNENEYPFDKFIYVMKHFFSLLIECNILNKQNELNNDNDKIYLNKINELLIGDLLFYEKIFKIQIKQYCDPLNELLNDSNFKGNVMDSKLGCKVDEMIQIFEELKENLNQARRKIVEDGDLKHLNL